MITGPVRNLISRLPATARNLTKSFTNTPYHDLCDQAYKPKTEKPLQLMKMANLNQPELELKATFYQDMFQENQIAASKMLKSTRLTILPTPKTHP